MYSQCKSATSSIDKQVKTFPNLSAICKMKNYEQRTHTECIATSEKTSKSTACDIELLIILMLLINNDNTKEYELILPLILKLLV